VSIVWSACRVPALTVMTAWPPGRRINSIAGTVAVQRPRIMDMEPATPSDWVRLNRAYWDERVPIHAGSSRYELPRFVAGKDTLRPFEASEVGDVTGRTLTCYNSGRIAGGV